MSALLTYTGAAKNNFILCDSDGTPNTSGLYVKLQYTHYKMCVADALIGNIFIDVTDAENPAAKIVEIASLSNIYGNRLFITTDPWKTIWYDREMTNTAESSTLTELDKVMLYMNLAEIVIDSEGLMVIDSNGKPVVAPKSTTVIS